ncbi:MAG: Chromate resistance protein ChrB, partial [Dongiaceae bacterium]
MLLHQLPPKPAYFRVKVWRRLQVLGAVSVKNSVYALPANDETREDFQWLLREIADGGGEACICEAKMVDGLSDAEIRALFDAARDVDYRELAYEARAVGEALRQGPDATAESTAEPRAKLQRLRKRFAEVVAIDFFGANGRETTEGLLAELEARLAADGAVPPERPASDLSDLRGRTWLTRRCIQVDRMASAWLIRRFID